MVVEARAPCRRSRRVDFQAHRVKRRMIQEMALMLFFVLVGAIIVFLLLRVLNRV
jgi:hypothetical protein